MTRSQYGFTLTELAIALVIVSLLLTGAVVTLSAQQEIANVAETEKTLEEARDAIVGFAVAHGRLPCPALNSTTGRSSPEDGNTACTANPGAGIDGYLPAATLGIGPTDSQGFLLDAWGNRVRYMVSEADLSDADTENDNAFTTPGRMKDLGANGLSPDLIVCSAGAAGTTVCGATTLTQRAVAVIYSMGKNGAAIPTTNNELANTDNNALFVSTQSTDFDDVVLWLSPYTLYNRMIAAGAL